MSRLFTLTRAARLIGVTRANLQGKIRSGELPAFEGLVSARDLLRVYPQAKLEEGSGLERFERIKDAAFARRLRERLPPSMEVLNARIAELGRELAQARGEADAYRAALDKLRRGLEALDAGAPGRSAAGLLREIEASLREPQEVDESAELLAQESFIKIMTAHVQVRPSGHEFLVEGGDNLLEAALRAGLSLDYGCSSGSCGRCKARIVSGEVERTRHPDFALTAAEKAAGVVLMCCHTAVGDLVIEAREAHGARDMPLQSVVARVKGVKSLTPDVRLLHVQTPRTQRLRFLAGQSVSLMLDDGSATQLAVASCPCDERNLEFHVARHDLGRRAEDAFAARVFDSVAPGDAVRIEGPRGEFVLDETSTRPLVFIAWETGFAPVKSLIEHAMALESAETIDLCWLASTPSAHYLDNLCRAWSDALDDFHYTPVALGGSTPPSEASLREAVVQALRRPGRLADCDFYVAGSRQLARAVQGLAAEGSLPAERIFTAPGAGEREKLRQP